MPKTSFAGGVNPFAPNTVAPPVPTTQYTPKTTFAQGTNPFAWLSNHTPPKPTPKPKATFKAYLKGTTSRDEMYERLRVGNVQVEVTFDEFRQIKKQVLRYFANHDLTGIMTLRRRKNERNYTIWMERRYAHTNNRTNPTNPTRPAGTGHQGKTK